MRRGRPREFDLAPALDAALGVFARVGYEQASVQALSDAMGICKPSLYAAWGNKEALFIEAIHRYAAAGAAHQRAILDAHADGRAAFAALLADRIQSYTRAPSASPGCLVVAEAASQQAGYSAAVREAIAQVMQGGEALLRERLSRAQRDGDLAADADVPALAVYFSTVLAGLSVQARNGASAAALEAIARTAMQAWPAARMAPSA